MAMPGPPGPQFRGRRQAMPPQARLPLNPALEGFLRGIVLAALSTIVVYLLTYVQSAHLPAQLDIWIPVIVLVLRTVEGVLDHLKQS